jgi:hypothetical protein
MYFHYLEMEYWHLYNLWGQLGPYPEPIANRSRVAGK